MHTSHWSLIAIASMLGSLTLTNICGHPVDVNSLDYVGIGFSIIMGAVDWIKRHTNSNSVESTNDSLANQVEA